MFYYPHVCSIKRHVETRLSAGRVRQELVTIYPRIPCFFDSTPVTAGLTSRQRRTDAMLSSEVEALLLIDPQWDIRISDRVEIFNREYEVQYIRLATDMWGIGHYEVHLITVENR